MKNNNFFKYRRTKKPMTLVQVSIADKGDCVILVADRLITGTLSEDLPDYEFEAHSPKIIYHGNVGIGFAGSSLYADLMAEKINNKKDFDEIVKIVSNFIKNENEKEIAIFIKRYAGVKSKDFFERGNLPIPAEVRAFIYSQLKDFKVGCHCIIAGFDKKNKARIIIIDEQGQTTETTSFSVSSIGSGAPFSEVYFDLCEYDLNMDTNEALFFGYEAKQWAQSHTGVGNKTDILVLRKNKKPLEIYDNTELMKKLNKKYEEEKERHIKNRKDLLKGEI